MFKALSQHSPHLETGAGAGERQPGIRRDGRMNGWMDCGLIVRCGSGSWVGLKAAYSEFQAKFNRNAMV